MDTSCWLAPADYEPTELILGLEYLLTDRVIA